MNDLDAMSPGGTFPGGGSENSLSLADFTVEWRGSVTSTNDIAAALARGDIAADRVVIAADWQTAGRGRRGRAWVSEPGNLFLSILLRPGVIPAEAARLSFVAAVAVAEGISTVLAAHGHAAAAAAVSCKWPNDVVVAGRKLAGLLLESEAGPRGEVGWLIVGIGINVTHFPADVERPAVSLHALGATAVTPQEVLRAVVGRFSVLYRDWQSGRWPALRAGWLARAAGLGQPVTVRLPDREIAGVFKDLDPDGVLLLDRGDGEMPERITAGDVFLIGEGAA